MSGDEKLYAAALEIPLAERATFLERACGSDRILRQRIERLLAANDVADAFFESPVAARRPMIREEGPGDCIGRYKLLQQIGAGGCGVVFMAEQEQPVRRRVALKVIKLGMDTKAVIARFEAERQALARMEHPNIARVLDAGATDAGRPFFVMELVRGIPITRYCDEENLSTEQRLQLFIQVCHAIQHAHQKGVIHRDIKPSNILVTMHDDVRVPKVIDFGIAKATQGRLTDHTVFTAFEQFIGTPAYMSPEQAELNDLEVDPRSDIYSLGVLLYELLTGRPPFDPKTLAQNGIDEIRRIIREVEPPRPSTRINTLDSADRVAVAKLRGTLPAQLSTLMRGDLDWIVMRALEKNRIRRYDTASGLAADIKRHLANEPVVARPPSVAYRCQKFVARKKYPLIGAAAAVASLGAGLALSKLAFGENGRGEAAIAGGQSAGARPGQKAREVQASSRQVRSEVVASRKLPLSDANWVMAVSPDGRFIAYVNPNWDSVSIYETASAKTWEIGRTKTETPWNVVFSPDANQIAYDTAGTSLWVAKIDGSEPRELYARGAKKTTISPVAWSAANGQVLARVRDLVQNISTPVFVDLKTREAREIKPPDGNAEWSLSSDGRYLAQGVSRKVTVFDLVSRRETTLVNDHLKHLVGWARDDSEFLYSSDRTGTESLWTIAVKSGQPAGEPRFVKEYADRAGVGGVTRDGSIYYTEFRNSGNVFLAPANFETGEILDEPRLVIDRFPNVQATPVWSRDGQKLLLVTGGRQRRFVEVSLESGQQQDFPVATIFDRINRYSSSKDGDFMLVAGRKLSGSGGTAGIHRFEPASGKVETIVTQRSAEWLYHPRLSLDEKSFYYARREYTRTADGGRAWADFRDWADFIVRRDLHSTQEQIVYQLADSNSGWPYELSPDGLRLAIVASDRRQKDKLVALNVFTLSGGGQKEVIRLAPGETVNSLAWTPDGKRLVYAKETPAKEKKGPAQTAVWFTAVESGESVKLALSYPELGAFAIHPAGRQIAFQTGSMGATVDVWVMEGLIPKQVAPKEGPRTKVIAKSSSAGAEMHIPVEEISGPNNSILDRKFGLTATLPPGWTIKSGNRTNTWGNRIAFTAPNVTDDAWAFVTYRETEPGELATFHRQAGPSAAGARPTTPAELDAWMRVVAQGLERALNGKFQNYKNRPESFVSRTIAGQKAWSWLADYTLNGEHWTWYWTMIETGESGARFQLSVPTAKFDALRPAFDALIESTRLNPARPIPLDEITAPNHSILDRKFGLALTYPADWAISSAMRRSTGLNTISLKIPGASHVGINYRSTTPWEAPFVTIFPLKELGPKPTSPDEIDAWLRRYAQAMEEQRIQRNFTNYRIRVGSMVSRFVNGYATLSWTGDFTEEAKNRTEYFTLIYSENVIAQFFVGDSVASIEPFLPAIEQMIATLRLP